MRKMIFIIILILSMLMPFTVCGEEILNMDDFDISDSTETLHEAGYDDIDSEEIIGELTKGNISEVIKLICQMAYDKTIGDVVLVEKTLGNLLLIIILSAFFTNFASVFSGDNISDTGFYICYLVCITIMISLFESFCMLTTEFVKLLLQFMGALIPSYFLSVAIIGQVSAAGFYQLTLVIISICEFIFLKVAIPVVKIYLSISLVNNISREDLLSKTCDILKRFIKFINRSLLGVVTGLNVIQGLILPAVDSTKNTTVRKFMGTLPVVGDGTDAMTGIVLGSANLIKNSIGTFAIVAIIIICIIPYIKIQIYSVSTNVITALIQPVADQRVIGSLTSMCEGIKMLTRIIVTNALLFIISIAIICMTTNFK